MQNISQLDLRIKASEFKKKLNIQDDKDGKDGSDYVLTEKDKKQISEMIKVPVVEKIVETIKIEKPFYEMDKKTLKSIEKLIDSTFKKISWDDIKDKPDIVSYIIKTISAKTYSLSELDDIDISALTKNSDGKYVLGTAADEKVKYDAADPTAGYLADKIVAGNGISIAEGTGTDENKVEISATIVGMEKRHDWVAPNDYCGQAPLGSAENASVWTITRIVVANNGSTTTSTQTNVKWTDRLTIF